MFGPDKCGGTNKVHFIFQHKPPAQLINAVGRLTVIVCGAGVLLLVLCRLYSQSKESRHRQVGRKAFADASECADGPPHTFVRLLADTESRARLFTL